MLSEKMVQLGTNRSVIRDLLSMEIRERQKSEQKMYLISVLEIRVFPHRNV